MTDQNQPGYVTPRETDALDHALKEHLLGCRQCQQATAKGRPKGFGQRGTMCDEYFNIAKLWSGDASGLTT